MPLHVSIKVVLSRLNQLTVINYIIPAFQVPVKVRPCTTDNDAPICAWDQVVIVRTTPAQDIGVGEIWSWPFWSYDTAADSSDWNDFIPVLGQESRGICVASEDDELCFDGTTRGGDGPATVIVFFSRNILNFGVRL